MTQSDFIFKDTVSLHSEQHGTYLETMISQTNHSICYILTCLSNSKHSAVTETETKVADALKYIEETKETMDKNKKKLEEMAHDIGEIQRGINCFCTLEVR